MRIRDYKSITIISIYALVNAAIIAVALNRTEQDNLSARRPGKLAPDYTIIEDLDYFHLKNGIPQLSLAAYRMKSQEEESSEFDGPRGVYNYQQKNKTINYQAKNAIYKKQKEILTMINDVRINSDEAQYLADKVKYYLNKDLVVGTGNVHFTGEDLKTKDNLDIESDYMRAYPNSQQSFFKGQVRGFLKRNKKYEGMMNFKSQELHLDGVKSLAHLQGDVWMKRDSYVITSGKADIFLENFNKSLKYFVFNDDVKVSETVQTPEGATYRKSFSERLEGFGREQKMILSGAPRVEYGNDVVKGYKITIRENVDLIEVDDAMSDLQMKRKKTKE